MEKIKCYYNGRILTMDDANPEAEYVICEGNKIREAGCGTPMILESLSEEQKIDLGGRMMLPGFIDSHTHVLTAALNRFKVDLSDRSFADLDEMLAWVRKEKEDSGESWIAVFGFSEENIGTGEMVTRAKIDAYFPDVPVTIIRVCGHMCIVNSAAIAKLDPAKMAAIQGGAFMKDADGVYNGLASEGAQQYVLDTMPPVDPEHVLAYLRKEEKLQLAVGITSVHDAGTDMMAPRAYVDAYLDARKRGALGVRTYLMVRPCEDETPEAFYRYVAEKKDENAQDEFLRIGSVKLFADGSFGSRTAAITECFQDEPENFGLLLERTVDTYASSAADAGHQVAVHAIGDRSVRFVAEHYAASKKKDIARLRIEHAELLDDELIDYIKEHQILIMTQPIFIREFGRTYGRNLGEERAMRIQPLKTLLEHGVLVGFGTDYPVDDANPLIGIQTAMDRRIKGTDKVLNASECISFRDAARCYTINNAYGAFMENEIGSITPGKYADFVVISGIKEEAGEVRDLKDAVVDMTIVGAEEVYVREA